MFAYARPLNPAEAERDPAYAPKADSEDSQGKMKPMVDADGVDSRLTTAVGAMGVLHAEVLKHHKVAASLQEKRD